MKRFIINTAVVLLLTVAVLAAMSAWYEAQYVPSDLVRKYKAMPRELDVSCTGASHCERGYDFSEYPQYASFNFGLGSQSLTYDCRLLTYYQDRLKPGGTVFITLSFPMIASRPETEAEDFMSKNLRYYGILPPNMIKKYEIGYDIRLHLLPILGAKGNLPRVLLGILHGADDAWDRTTDAAFIATDKVRAFKGHVPNETGVYKVNEEELAAVYEMIEICHKHDVRPILVTTPFLAEYTDIFRRNAPDFMPFFFNVVDEIVRKTGVEYLDYSRDERFRYDYTLFIDVDHLNRKGARKFTKILMDRVGLR